MVLTLSPVFQFLSDKPKSRGFVFSFFPLMWGHFPYPAYRPYPAARRDDLQCSSLKIRTSRLSASRPLPRQWRDPPAWNRPSAAAETQQSIFQCHGPSRPAAPVPRRRKGGKTPPPDAQNRLFPSVLRDVCKKFIFHSRSFLGSPARAPCGGPQGWVNKTCG